MRPLLCLVVLAGLSSARDRDGSCPACPCPESHFTRESPREVFPWMGSVMRWEAMFPTIRGLGMFLASAGLDGEQAREIGELVAACDGELASLESELIPPGSLTPFPDVFTSEEFDQLDIELAEDRLDEFEDEAIVLVSASIARIREVLTESQLTGAGALDLYYGPDRCGPGADCTWRDPDIHRSRSASRPARR